MFMQNMCVISTNKQPVNRHDNKQLVNSEYWSHTKVLPLLLLLLYAFIIIIIIIGRRCYCVMQ